MSSLYVSTSLFSTIKKVPVTIVVYEVNITTACFIYKCLQMFLSFVPLLHLFISTETYIAFKVFSFHKALFTLMVIKTQISNSLDF